MSGNICLTLIAGGGDTPPARQVEVAVDSRAETGYGVVLDRTRPFLARLLCHKG